MFVQNEFVFQNILDSLSKKIVDIKMVVQENLWVQKKCGQTMKLD